MGFVDIFKAILGGDPLKGISDLIGQITGKMTPEQKVALDQAMQQMELQREQIQAARDTAFAQIQSANITAETKSEDAYVRRARPTFLYVMIAAIGYSLLVAPIINAFLHKGLVPMDIPGAYLELFGVSFLGYVGARTWEKTKGVNQ